MDSIAVDQCREAGLSLLDRRAYTREDLRKALARRKTFPPAVISAAIESLVGAGLIDDVGFARTQAELKLAGRSGHSTARVVNDLRRRGIRSEAVQEALDTLPELTDAAAELERAVQAGQSKWRLCSRGPDARANRAKLFRFLAGRGFRSDVCWRAVGQITGAQEAADDGGRDDDKT